ncbi:MAG: NADP-dependent isocitrate dehydrogenase [Pseudomonadota bacterium]
MSTDKTKIIYTETDEAPRLATYSLLPVIEAFTKAAGVSVETRNISLASRIISQFPEYLTEQQQQSDALAELGEMAKTPEANIIKLPNISASIPQMTACIKELQEHGYKLPDYPFDPQTDEENDVRSRYDKVKGSAVNPVLREGNSDRRAPSAVKNYVQKHPHRMGQWSKDSQTHVAHMNDGDFYSSENSLTSKTADDFKIVFESGSDQQVLKSSVPVLAGEVVDAAVMSKKQLQSFYEKETAAAKEQGVLLSLHLKATMMKVSDPIMFGHAVRVYYKDVLEKHADVMSQIDFDASNGIGDLYNKLDKLTPEQRDAVESDLNSVYAKQPELAMVNSDKGITNLHVPSDIIIDASMPAMIRDSGKMWDTEGGQKDAKAMIPDRSYAGVYQETIDFCRENGAFDPSTMGTVPNVGLMAKKAEEYGSHDKTFEIPADGVVKVFNQAGDVVFEHAVEEGDIWRMCQVKDEPIRDWVKLAVKRSRLSGMPAVFWLDSNRAHDAQLIEKVKTYLAEQDTDGLDISIMAPVEATRHTLQRVKAGKDTISVTGNVLRDYLTDLFPILELGTSAKMLSIVPLMNGGGLFETGAGGSAPKHVQQFVEENHLRWDSLGEFLALAASLEHLSQTFDNKRAQLLADSLDKANAKFLEQDKSPSRKAGELDNRGSHFYLALYWAEALANQNDDSDLKARFAKLFEQFSDNEQAIVNELNEVQGAKVDIGGYYQPDTDKVSAAMRPCQLLNKALASL